MHELSICDALLIQVADIVRARGADAVECITIEVGPLSGTEPDLLMNAFLVMRSGPAALARLIIKRCPVRIACLNCGAVNETEVNRLICMNCGGWRTRVIAGTELRLLRVEMHLPHLMEPPGHQPTEEQLGHV